MSSVVVGQAETIPAPARAAIRLLPPTAMSAAEFSVVSSVRELADGRALVSDEKEGRLAVVDFRSGSVTTVGGRGSGPGEYRQVARVWAIPGDSSLHKEPFAARLLLLDGTRIVHTVGPADSSLRSIGSSMLLGVDARGGLIVARYGRDAGGRPALDDSLVLVRVFRGTSRVDSIARLQSGQAWSAGAGVAAASRGPVPAGAPPPSTKRTYVVSLNAPDQVAVFPDGWIAIARTNPYRVDWCPTDQRCTTGPVLSTARPPLTDREKRAYLEIAAKTHGWPPTSDLSETTGWPRFLPPFVVRPSRIDAGALLAMPDGSVLIERLPTADAMWVRYDIITRTGVLAGHLQLPLGEQIVGFGRASVYVVTTDADGLQRLRRHPWSFSSGQKK